MNLCLQQWSFKNGLKIGLKQEKINSDTEISNPWSNSYEE